MKRRRRSPVPGTQTGRAAPAFPLRLRCRPLSGAPGHECV